MLCVQCQRISNYISTSNKQINYHLQTFKLKVNDKKKNLCKNTTNYKKYKNLKPEIVDNNKNNQKIRKTTNLKSKI